MNRLEKAAAFGARMGKRAGLVKKSDRFYDGAPGKKYGDPSLKAPSSLSANQVQASEQLNGNVPIPGVQEGPAGKNRDMARINHFQEAARANNANLTEGSVSAERSTQQKDSDGKAISTVASMLPFSRVANVPLNRAPSAQAARPITAAKSSVTPSFDPMKTLGPNDSFKGLIANSRRGSIKPPTPSMAPVPASPKPLTGEVLYRSPTPGNDAMMQYGMDNPTKTMKPHMFDHLNPPGPRSTGRPPVGKPFTKLPNQ